MPMGLVGHNQKEQCPHYGNSRKREKETERLFKAMMAINFPNPGREMDIQVHEAQRTPRKLNLYRATPGHIIIVKSQR